MDAISRALVGHAVHQLVVDLVGLADLQLERAAVDGEAHPRIGRDGHVDPVAAIEGRVRVAMWVDLAAGQQLGGQGADDAPTRRIPALDDRIHEWHGYRGQAFPAGLPLHVDARPGIDFGKQQYDGLRQPMHLVVLLPLHLLVPGRVILRGDGRCQRRDVYRAMA